MPTNGKANRRSILKSMVAAGVLPAGISEVQAEVPDETSLPKHRMQTVIPVPVNVKSTGAGYTISEETAIQVTSDAATGVAEYLASLLRPPTGYELPIVSSPPHGPGGRLLLTLDGAPAKVGDQGYRLQSNPSGVTVRANEPAGLFAGVQTLRQLLPPTIESDTEQSGSWTVPGGHITDYPRFEYRGALLDVAREFYPVEDVKRFIDQISTYKINYLHLHLTDDSGWRIMIDSWPRLATYGGQTDFEGGEGGYYTKDEYREIVDYARSRNVTIVPEIDMPGHTAAALASYPELACEGEEWDIGNAHHQSSLCIEKDIVYEFAEDVIREVAELTPGPYIHIGGDEALGTSDEEYKYFFDQVLPLVEQYDKRPIGWHAVLTRADPPSSTIGQYWGSSREAPEVESAAEDGTDLILSPLSRAYLDLKYDTNTPPDIGLDYDLNSVKDTYTWDPGSYLDGVDESSVLGPEAALWGETLDTYTDVERLLFPRLPGIAELGWSPASKTNWEEYKYRLASQASRWVESDTNFYKSPQLSWPAQKAIEVDDIDVQSTLLGGTSTAVDVTVTNWSTDDATVSVSIDASAEWDSTSATVRVPSEDSATVSVEITPPSDRTEVTLSAVVDAPSPYNVINLEREVTILPESTTRTVDESENDYTGLLHGSPEIVDVDSGEALSLDGEDDYVDVNLFKEAPKLNFTEPGFTIVARVRPAEITSSVPIVNKGDRQYALKILGPGRGKRPEFFIYDDDWSVASAAPPDDWENHWHTLAGVCTESELRLYVDGELQAETSHDVSQLNEAPAPVHVGHNAQANFFAEGTFDKVHVYDRALSASELDVTRDEPTEDAVLWYDFDSYINR